MNKEYFEELKKAAPEMMKRFCSIYGYTEHEGEYYSNYLVQATGKSIPNLQDSFDANLEPFKLEVGLVIAHLEANGYMFPSKIIGSNYSVNLHHDDLSIHKNIQANSLESVLQDASVIASKHLEQKL